MEFVSFVHFLLNKSQKKKNTSVGEDAPWVFWPKPPEGILSQLSIVKWFELSEESILYLAAN